MVRQVPDVVRSVSYSYREADCGNLKEISPDFHDDLREQCPLCSGTGPECIVDRLKSVAATGTF